VTDVAIGLAMGLLLGAAAWRLWLVDRGLNYTQALERAYANGSLQRPSDGSSGPLHFGVQMAWR
jgi:hypothetical protein